MNPCSGSIHEPLLGEHPVSQSIQHPVSQSSLGPLFSWLTLVLGGTRHIPSPYFRVRAIICRSTLIITEFFLSFRSLNFATFVTIYLPLFVYYSLINYYIIYIYTLIKE